MEVLGTKNYRTKTICQEWESPDALEQHVRQGSVGAEEWKLDIITKCRYLDVPGSEEKVTKWIIATTKTPFINRLELTH